MSAVHSNTLARVGAASDFMAALSLNGVPIHRDAEGRYSLNDFHEAAGGAKADEPNRFLRLKKTEALIAEIQETMQIHTVSETTHKWAVSTVEGRNGGTYAVENLVIAYAAWISAKFYAHVLETFKQAAIAKVRAERAAPAIDADEQKLRRDFIMIGLAAENLSLSPSTRLRMNTACAELHGCSTALLPAYAVDAPTDGSQDSSLATDSLRSLLSGLRAHYRATKPGKKVMTAHEFYSLMEFAGLADHNSRKSTSKDADESGLKWFWTIKGDGLRYAKNVTDPKAHRQTQPLFYRDRFDGLRHMLADFMPDYLKHKAEKAIKEAAEAASSAPKRLSNRDAAERRADLR